MTEARAETMVKVVFFCCFQLNRTLLKLFIKIILLSILPDKERVQRAQNQKEKETLLSERFLLPQHMLFFPLKRRDIVFCYKSDQEKIKASLFLLNETIEKDTAGPYFQGLMFDAFLNKEPDRENILINTLEVISWLQIPEGKARSYLSVGAACIEEDVQYE